MRLQYANLAHEKVVKMCSEPLIEMVNVRTAPFGAGLLKVGVEITLGALLLDA